MDTTSKVGRATVFVIYHVWVKLLDPLAQSESDSRQSLPQPYGALTPGVWSQCVTVRWLCGMISMCEADHVLDRDAYSSPKVDATSMVGDTSLIGHSKWQAH